MYAYDYTSHIEIPSLGQYEEQKTKSINLKRIYSLPRDGVLLESQSECRNLSLRAPIKIGGRIIADGRYISLQNHYARAYKMGKI